MIDRRAPGSGWALLFLLLLEGCLPSGDSTPPRYFLIEAPKSELTPRQDDRLDDVVLRLRRLDTSSYLKERMAWRGPDSEAGFDDLHRWVEGPGEALERIVSQRLYEVLGLTRTLSGTAESLELSLLAADDVRGPRRQALLRVRAIHIDSDQNARWEETFEESLPVEGPGANDFASALGKGMGKIADRIATRVVESLLEES